MPNRAAVKTTNEESSAARATRWEVVRPNPRSSDLLCWSCMHQPRAGIVRACPSSPDLLTFVANFIGNFVEKGRNSTKVSDKVCDKGAEVQAIGSSSS